MARVAWSRPEPFGAWVRLDDATLVAVDARLADRLGVASGGDPDAATRPLEVHLAVTARCPAPCTGCYLDAQPDGEEPSFEAIAARLAAARDGGASTVALGGGEPLTRKDLGRIAAEARRLGLVPVMTTSGIGLTAARAAELGAFAQINVSHDGVSGGYEAVRGWGGEGHAERAIRLLSAAGVPVGVNVVLTRASFPALEATCERAAELGAVEAQLLRYKPAGRAEGAAYAALRLGEGDVRALWPAIARIVAARRLRLRIDCSMVPLLSEALLAAAPNPAETLAALGVFGCEAGRHLGALRVDGTTAPCSFFSLPSSAGRRATGGDIVDARIQSGTDEYGDRFALPILVQARGELRAVAAQREGSTPPAPASAARDVAAIRAYHADPAEPCRSCPLFAVCRGGCQVVSVHARGAFAPDPECPRVLAHAARAGA